MGLLSSLLPAGTMGAVVILVVMTVSSGRNNNHQKGELPSDLGHVSSFEGAGSFFFSIRSPGGKRKELVFDVFDLPLEVCLHCLDL